jgi:serine protease Do
MLKSGWTNGLAAAIAVAALLGVEDARAQEHDEHRAVREHRERNVHINVATSGHGTLGVRLKDVDDEAAARLAIGDPRGALVEQVTDGSAAEKAGLRKDDVIVAFRGEPVHSVAQLVRLVRETPVGREIAIQVLRAGASTSLNATLEAGDRWGLRWFGEPGAQYRYSFRSGGGGEGEGEGAHIIELPEMPDIEVPDFTTQSWFPELSRGRKLGIDYQPVEGQLAEYFGVEQGEGILITSVVEDGPAFKAGLKAGDILLEIDGKKLRDRRDLFRVVADLEPGAEVTVKVLRNRELESLAVTVGGKARRVGGGEST